LRTAGLLCTLGFCCLLQCACADRSRDAAQTYVVRPEDTLYSIAWRHDLDYRDLARWNHIGADFRISVGQVLSLSPGARSRREAAIQSTPRLGAAPWVWPTDPAGAARGSPGGGIFLSGHLGQDVRAASAGRVVYTGGGLRGYGNLIIVKHAANLLSAYAHNSEILVREGQEVAAGQVIAHMGLGPQQAPLLYFEIRQNGKPIDPIPFLSTEK